MCSRLEELCLGRCIAAYRPNFSVQYHATGGPKNRFRPDDPFKTMACCTECQVIPEGETKTVFELRKDSFLNGDGNEHHTPCSKCHKNNKCGSQLKEGLQDP